MHSPLTFLQAAIEAKRARQAQKRARELDLEVTALELSYVQNLLIAGWPLDLAMMEANYQAADDVSPDWFFRKFGTK